jgi:hypothetical protein
MNPWNLVMDKESTLYKRWVITMIKTDMAWGLSFGFCSTGTLESLKNGNNFCADGAISNILQTSINATVNNLYYNIWKMQC